MKDDWLKNIHDKMSEYETDVPDGLWTRVDTAVSRRRRHSVWLWTGRLMAAASVMAVIATAGYHLLRQPGNDSLQASAPGTAATAPGTPAAIASANNAHSLPDRQDAPSSPSVITAGELRHEPYARLAHHAETEASSAQAEKPEQNVAPSPVTDNGAKDTVGVEKTHTLPAVAFQKADTRRNDRQGKTPGNTSDTHTGNFAMGIYTSAATGGTMSERYSSFGLMAAAPGAAEWKGNPHQGLMVSNQGRVSERNVRHRLPVHAGASVAYRINDRVSVETGLSYSYLSADIREGSDTYYFAGDQSLHYIGIPVAVRFRALSWKKFDVYVGAGAMAEKCVSGKLEKAYVIGGVTHDDGSESISIKPLQWSLNATAGLQYNATPILGIYAEPGVSYYFDNGSKVETIYGEKPFNFNLNIGLRLTFGQR